MRLAVTRYGPPTLMLGMLYAPPARATARYAVPLGTCTATTFASGNGAPSRSLTVPLIAAVVTPYPNSIAGTHRNAHSTRLVAFTRSSLACECRKKSCFALRVSTPAGGYKGEPELAPERRGGKGRYYRPSFTHAKPRHRPPVRRGRRSPGDPGCQPVPRAGLSQRGTGWRSPPSTRPSATPRSAAMADAGLHHTH